MHYGLDVGALPVDPDVEAHAGIRPAAFQRLEVFVDEHHPFGRRFFKAVAELQGPERPGLVGPRGDLAGEAGFVILLAQDLAARGEELRSRALEKRQVLVHLPADALHEMRLAFHRMKLGSRVEMIGNATRIARRMQSAAMNGITPWKMVRVGTCGRSVLSTNRFMPTGGLIRPISTTTTIRMPNQIGSTPRETMTGKKTGTVSRIIDSSSIAVPSRT